MPNLYQPNSGRRRGRVNRVERRESVEIEHGEWNRDREGKCRDEGCEVQKVNQFLK